MDCKVTHTRYAHCEGHTGVCFSEDARFIITCGNEGDIRVWAGFNDDDAKDKCVGEKAYAVCQRGGKLYVGTDQNSVQILTFPEVELDGVLARFTAPVVDIDASADGSLVVSASCDMTIGITDVLKGTTDTLTGHRAPVLSVVLDPKLEYLASSSCDGTVKVWLLSEKREVVSWDCVPKSNSFQFATSMGRAAWQPITGARLVVPGTDEVKIYQRGSWEKTSTLSVPGSLQQVFSVVKISCCGQYIAASTTKGVIHIWHLNMQSLIASYETVERLHICSLDWNSELPQIAFCDYNGGFGTIDLETSIEKKESEVNPEDVPMADPEFGDTDDEDNENAISLEKIKNESGFLADGLEDDDKFSVKDEEDGRGSRQSDVRPSISVDLQPPFQPSSTPNTLQYRYMVWNDIGIVRQTNTEEETAIDVEFHDTNHHHAFRVNNMVGHSMAALSAEVLVLACEASEDNPSKVVCVMLNAWDGSKEWSTLLHEDEEAMCVAAGQNFVAVVTDTRTLRVFTTCGTQREVLSLSGPAVCLAAHHHSLAVVFHSGIGLNGDQCLSYQELWLGSNDTLVRQCVVRRLPLSPRARLRWLGYSEEGSLCALDTAGVLRKLTPSSIWSPICDVDKQCKGKSDHYFVVGINEKFQTIRGILCKGAFYPPTMPRPTVTEISWKVPLCESSVEKGELEEQFWRSQVALTSLSESEDARDAADRTIKKSLLKLFALACQSGLEMRAVGLCQLMPPEVVELAVKYASKLGRLQLADKIADMVQRRPPTPPPSHRSYDSNMERQCAGVEDQTDVRAPALSQDMFAPTPASVCENPILALKQKQGATGSVLTNKMRRSNPFKKSDDGKEDTDKGLAGLTKQVLAKPPSRTPQPETTVPSKRATTNENKPKKNVFMDWFSSQKESLEEEFPDLDTADLTKLALKRFKEEQKSKLNNNQSVKKFFGSTSNPENTNQNASSTPVINTDVESKKRKTLDDDAADKPDSKKTSTASKLKKFSFVKP